MSADDIKLPPLARPQVPRIAIAQLETVNAYLGAAMAARPQGEEVR